MRSDWVPDDELYVSTTTTSAVPETICPGGFCSIAALAARTCVDGVCSATRFTCEASATVASVARDAVVSFFDLPIEQQIKLATGGIIVINGVKLVATCVNPTVGAVALTLMVLNNGLTIEGYHRLEGFLRGSDRNEIVLKKR